MDKIIIATALLVLSGCTSDPNPLSSIDEGSRGTETDTLSAPSLSIELDSDSLTDDTTELIFHAKEWDEEEISTNL